MPYDATNEESKMDYIFANTSKAAIYEQLAEECSELAQAALKVARNLRGENESRVPQTIAYRNVEIEFTDVLLCAELLKIQADNDVFRHKLNRWVDYIDRRYMTR